MHCHTRRAPSGALASFPLILPCARIGRLVFLLLTFIVNSLFAGPATPAPGPLANTFARLSTGQPLKVVVIGNSVTAGAPAGRKTTPSFYVALNTWLTKTFPDAPVDVVPKIIYAIGPEVQLFYQDSRLFPEAPDLVVAEFGAANGAWGRTGAVVTEPATEGYLRRLRERFPRADVILMMGMFRTLLDDYTANTEPPSSAFLHRAAAHYNALAVDAGREVARRVLGGEPWSTYMDDVIHPSARGYTLYSELLVTAVEREWRRFQTSPLSLTRAHSQPAHTLHVTPWASPRLVPASETRVNGFSPRTHGTLAFLESARPDATGTYTAPTGRQIVGVLMRAAQPLGNLEVRVPGGVWVRLTQRDTPHFTTFEDRANPLYRNFFATSGLPAPVTEIEFRVSPNPESHEAGAVQLVGVFEIALRSPSASHITAPAP